METETFKKSEVSKTQRIKWMIEDMAGLYIHKTMAWISKDEEIKQKYYEMRKAVIQEGDQPKATQISDEIRAKIMENTQKRLK